LPNNISLLPLPPYSPELNPMENIWDVLRSNRLSSWVWASYEAILDACKDAWNFPIADRDSIDFAAHRSWVWANLQVGWYYRTR
jgi:transposase